MSPALGIVESKPLDHQGSMCVCVCVEVTMGVENLEGASLIREVGGGIKRQKR